MFSLVIPVFQRFDTLPVLVQQARKLSSRLPGPLELVFVDDANPEYIAQMLDRLRYSAGAWVQVLHLPYNQGQHAATLAGLQAARGQWIFTADDDLKVSITELFKLWEKAQNGAVQLVYADLSTLASPAPWWRIAGSQLFRQLFRYWTPYPEKLSSFRLLHRRIVPTGFPPNPMLDVLLWKQRPVTVFVPVEANSKLLPSTYTFWKLWKFLPAFWRSLWWEST